MATKSDTRTLPIAAERIDIAEWLFGLSDDEYRATARAHLGAGTFRTRDGRRGFFDAEGFAAAFIVNHHVEEQARPDYVRVRSRNSRAWVLRLLPLRLDVTWEMIVRSRGADRCELECCLAIDPPHRALEPARDAVGRPDRAPPPPARADDGVRRRRAREVRRMMRRTLALDVLTALRARIGAGAYPTPAIVWRLLGFRGGARDELRYVSRIWGARNLALAAATRAAPPGRRGGWLAVNVAIDLADVASGCAYVRRRRPGALSGVTAIAPAAVAATLGVTPARADARAGDHRPPAHHFDVPRHEWPGRS